MKKCDIIIPIYNCRKYLEGFPFESYLNFYQRYNFTACNYCDGAIKGKDEIAAGEQIR